MIEQYKVLHRQLKSQHPDAILFFRLGDFYEMFYDDAKIGAKELNIVLTARKEIPMAGVPYHAAEKYITTLVKKGYKVAICEQVEDPKASKGIVKREIVRIITPGTITEDFMLDAKSNNYLMAISLSKSNKRLGVATIDISTGEFIASEFTGENFLSEFQTELHRLNPAECILPMDLESNEDLKFIFSTNPNTTITPMEDHFFDYENAYKALTDHFKTLNLKGFGLENLDFAINAAGAIISYLQDTQKGELANITGISKYSTADYMILDMTTQRSLEITRSFLDGTSKGTLLEIFDQTVTAMGGRLLIQWLLRPLLNKEKISERLDAVEEMYKDIFLRQDLREILNKMSDIERLVSRISIGRANAKDLLSLKDSLTTIPDIRKTLSTTKSKLIQELINNLHELPEIAELIEKSISPDAPQSLHEGGIILDGYNSTLDELREITRTGKQWIANYEEKERRRTGIKSLKVGYNKVFGYYIDVTKPHVSKVPKEYIRKQTLVGSERYITPELKEWEEKIISAEDKIKNLEYELFTEIREEVKGHTEEMQENGRIIATLDCLSTFAEIAIQNNYVKPEINDSDKIIIKKGRHPVVEKLLITEQFIPNDVEIDCRENQLLIITGPNMSGKSTYIRQVALIVLMAQIGSFVPAEEASIGIVDRIFTRVGAFDVIAAQQSTFMVEMNETANILNNATEKSLIILDEIGRGTSTFDGVSIAWAVAEYIHENPRISAKTMFATHYHQLCELADILPRAKNFHVAVKQKEDGILFIHKVLPGGTDKSYGIQVARLAGVPYPVISRAKEILEILEGQIDRVEPEKARLEDKVEPRKYPSVVSIQTELFRFGQITKPPKTEISKIMDEGILEDLLKLDISNMTPLDALNAINELKKKAESLKTKK